MSSARPAIPQGTTPTPQSQIENFSAPYQHELMGHSEGMRQAGINAGAQNKPLSAATALDPSENEIQHLAEKMGASCQAHYEKRLRNQANELDRLESDIKNESYIVTLSRLVETCRTQLGQVFAREKASLLSLKQDELSLEAALNSFKQIHGRREPAHYPPSETAHYYLLATIAVVEALLNIGFYGEYKGVSSALLIAFGASIANVVVSTFLGTRWRFKNSIESKDRIIGWSFFTAWVVYTFYLNKFLSVFRASLADKALAGNMKGVDPIIAASKVAFDNVFAFPFSGFSILDITSWFLLIIGMIIAVTSFLKGYYADDTYPGYGVITRKYLAARDAYLEQENRLRQAANALIQEAEAKIAETETSKQARLNDFNEMVQLADKTVSDYQADLAGINSDLVYLLKTYRDANRSVRTTPEPSYFANPGSIAAAEISLGEKWQKKAVEKQRLTLHTSTKQALDMCSSTRRELGQLNQENAKQVDDFFRTVETDAKKRIGGLA